MIEVGMIGNEGLVGMPILLGAETSPLEAMVQIPGSALRIEAGLFRDEVGLAPPLWVCCFGTSRYFTFRSRYPQLATRHSLPERLARWLLMARDRATSDRMPLSHEFLAMMLGVRRAGVTVAVGTLKAAG